MPRSKKDAPQKRKSAARKTRVKVKPAPASRPQALKTSSKAAGSNRAEGIRLFKLAGRPTREQFILVYGERGPKMTWEQRAKAGISAKQFPAALAAKQSGRKDAKPSIPALTVKD